MKAGFALASRVRLEQRMLIKKHRRSGFELNFVNGIVASSFVGIPFEELALDLYLRHLFKCTYYYVHTQMAHNNLNLSDKMGIETKR